MPIVNPSPLGPKPQYELASGLPAVGYQLYFYLAGSVGTKQNTYTNSTGAVANPNPIVLNALGQPNAEIWFESGRAYKVMMAPDTDSDPPTSPIWSIDALAGMNDVAGFSNEWIVSNIPPTFVDATHFSMPGDQTVNFQIGRRVKTINSGGAIYSTINASVFSSGLTTITVVNDAGVLDSGLSAVSYGIISAQYTSLPAQGVGTFLPLVGGTLTGNLVISGGASADVSGVLSGGAAGGTMIATQLQMKTGTATDRVVTPGLQHWHPSAAKGWGKIQSDGGVVVQRNIASVTVNGVGDITVIWGTPFATAHYVAIVSVLSDLDLRATVPQTGYSAGSTRILVRDNAGNATNPNYFLIVAYGDQ
jgi:hypothetical protein